MRALALPAALLLSFLLYLCFPKLSEYAASGIRRLYALLLPRFTRKDGAADDRPALAVFCLMLSGAAALIGAVHPIVSALICAALFPGLSILPQSAAIKDELDSGLYARDIPAYESRVRTACASLAPAFVSDVCAPLLLIALGTPLYLGTALGTAWLCLRALCSENRDAMRIVTLLLRPADAVMRAMMLLCSGVVGRNPTRTSGGRAKERLISILGIAGDETDTHAPMAGDIAQGVFLCCFAVVLLCVMLTFVLLAVC